MKIENRDKVMSLIDDIDALYKNICELKEYKEYLSKNQSESIEIQTETYEFIDINYNIYFGMIQQQISYLKEIKEELLTKLKEL